MKQLDRRQVETMGWPILEPIEAEGVPRPIALSKDVCIAGAREAVNLKLQSPLISRTHALFVADRDSIYLRDLASRNHTYLNDEPIREAVLRNGDVIGLGPMTFRCQSGFDRPYESDEFHAPPGELRLESDDTRFPVNGRTALIGSRRDCDILLPGDDVDPAHAVVYQRDARRFIRDLRSHSYTLVNNERVKDAELHPGDRIQIGDFHLIYETASAPVETEIPFDLNQAPELDQSDPLDDTHSIPLSMEDVPEDPAFSPAITEEPEAEPVGLNLAEAPAEERENPPRSPAPSEGDTIPLAEESEPEEQISFPPAALEEENLDLQAAPESSTPVEATDLEPTTTDEQNIPDLVPDETDDVAQAHAPVEAPHLEEAYIPVEAHSSVEARGPVGTHGAKSEEHELHPAAEEKLTELLGELVETVEKVQSTWEEIKSGAA